MNAFAIDNKLCDPNSHLVMNGPDGWLGKSIGFSYGRSDVQIPVKLMINQMKSSFPKRDKPWSKKSSLQYQVQRSLVVFLKLFLNMYYICIYIHISKAPFQNTIYKLDIGIHCKPTFFKWRLAFWKRPLQMYSCHYLARSTKQCIHMSALVDTLD